MQGDDTPTDIGKSDDRLRLALVVEDLPAGFDVLRAEARAEGHLFPERLAGDWQSRTLRFDRKGEALLAAFCSEVLAGIGGLTIDPVVPEALRMRRFYVRAPFRRHGIGRRLATALLDQARRTGRPITVNAAPDSVRFWETLGFKPDRRDGHTHILDPSEL
jgi:GNAT superfamily N-acetyltransferase